jgi:alkylation response protein AidB-like acyl-CoA dehydrogenase
MLRKLYNEEHELFRQSVRQFFETEVAPFHDGWEVQGHVDRQVWNKAGAMGILCTTAPEAYGGAGVDFRYSCIIAEEQVRVHASGIGFGLHSEIICPYIDHYGTEEQKQKYLPKLISGEMIGALAMTEPGTGSDVQAIKSNAIRNGDHYVLNGSKTFITNGYLSDLVIVAAKTDPKQGASGVSLLIVETAWEGFSKNKPLKKIGMKAQDTCELFFDNVKVPAENLLGAEGAGFYYMMQELPQERLIIAVVAVAACEQAIADTLKYTRERQAFGKDIFAFQNTRFKLAELWAETQMARAFVDRCVEMLVDGQLDVPTAAAAKLVTTELQCKVVDECLQFFGGYGYIWDFPIARAYADSRVQKIYGGTNEIMKELISRAL